MESKIVYFDKPGTENTDEVFRIVKQRAEELGIKTIVVASTTGETAAKAAKFFKQKIVAVGWSVGFAEANVQRFTEESRKIVVDKGGVVLNATHAFAGVSRALKNKTNTVSIGDTIAETLRILGQGMKVVCEVSMMAADAGLVKVGEDVIVIAGTGRGSDTAVVLIPVTSQTFFDLKIKEILCKPHF